MHIICQWQVWGPDAYPEFAPNPICYEDCKQPATTRVTGSDSFNVDVFVCDAHLAPCMDGLLNAETEAIEAMYARGYATAAAQASLADLSYDQAQFILHEDEWPDELAPDPALSGEWATGEGHASLGEIVLSDGDAAQYEAGYMRGWSDRLCERASWLMQLHHDEDDRVS